MADYTAASPHQPKGDHNRRLALGLSPEDFARQAGVGVEALRDYERTSPDHPYDPLVASRVAAALERLEPGTRSMPEVSSEAAALRDGEKPGPAEAAVQVRDAGAESQATPPDEWDAVDEAVDETFPASDPTTKY